MSGTGDGTTHDDHSVYEVVSQRRTQYDMLLWQVPTLSLTAQAFLFSIALSAEASMVARIVASLLAAVAALLSMQLMAKHRLHEMKDSIWLQSYEESRGWPQMHAPGSKRPTAYPRTIEQASESPIPWWLRLRSYELWMAGLAVFGAAAVLIAILALANPSLLSMAQ